MQTLDVISVNVWQILISLLNLVVLYLIVKFFLYNPVKNVLAKRSAELEEHYTAAEEAEAVADKSRMEWEEKLSGANAEANSIIQNATDLARNRGDAMITEAREKADGIIRVAQNEAELERRRATDQIKKEIVNVSAALTEKILEREVNTNDHKALIDSFIENIGDGNE